MAGHVKYLSDENFETETATGLTLVDFYADWCGPCRMIAPIIEELSTELNGQVTIAKVDIEAAQQVTSNTGVTSIPTIVLFKDGKEVSRVVGVKSKDELKNMIKKEL